MSSSGQDMFARGTAVYGAVAATVGLLWTIRRDLRDRAHLRVRAAVPIGEDSEMRVVGDLVAFEVVNTGRRAVHLRDVGGRYVDGRPFRLALFTEAPVPDQHLPAKLEPTERVVIGTALPADPRAIRTLCARDTLGKEYHAPAGDVRNVQRHTLEHRAQPDRLSLRERLRPALPIWMPV